MFKQKTVFILGAGASCDYGYPTGEQLVRDVILSARQAVAFLRVAEAYPMPDYAKERFDPSHDSTKGTYLKVADEFSNLADQLEQVNPLVIDYFLADHKSMQTVGKLMIAHVLLQCEAKSQAAVARKDWYRFLIHRLTYECTSSDLRKNEVTFVTFNYDVSLEARLMAALRLIEKFNREDVEMFFDNGRVLHMYGSLRDLSLDTIRPGLSPILKESLSLGWGENTHLEIIDTLNIAYKASKGIRTISDEKGLDKDTIARAEAAIAEARFVYILGYGFDPANSRRLSLDAHLLYDLLKNDRRVIFTNYGDSNRVNKEASMLFFRSRSRIYSGSQLVSANVNSEISIERSTKDVYSAFSFDFDSPEQSEATS
jgi:hypothetical protein